MQLTQFPFLQALGFALINSLWQFALLWLLYLLLTKVFGLSSHKKYTIALTLQFAGFFWFAGTLIFYYVQCLQVVETVKELEAVYSLTIETSGSSLKDRLLNILLRGEQLLPYLSVAYIILLLFVSIKTARCYKYTQQVRAVGLQKIDVEWRLFVQKIAGQLGIKRRVRIFVSKVVQSPVTLGFLKPVILLPLATLNNLTTHQIEAVLLHELAHIKRNDYLINLLLTVVETALFFNPFMQLISSQIKRERENSCDDWVLQYNYNVASYATALLTIARNKNTFRSSLAMNAADNQTLLLRVKRMIEKKECSHNYRQQLIALVLMTCLISTLAWLVPNRYSKSYAAFSTQEKIVVVEPFAAKVQNPLFNPVFFLANKEKQQKLQTTKSDYAGDTVLTVTQFAASTIIKSNITLQRKLTKEQTPPPAPPVPSEAQDAPLPVDVLDTAINYVVEQLTRKTQTVHFQKIEEDIKKAKEDLIKVKLKEFRGSQEVQKQIQETLLELNRLDLKLISQASIKANLREKTAKGEAILERKCTEIEQKKYLRKEAEEKLQHMDEQDNRNFIRRAINRELMNNSNLDIEKPEPHDEPWSYSYYKKPRIFIAPGISSITINIPSEFKHRKDLKLELIEVNLQDTIQIEKIRRSVRAKKSNIVRI